MAEAPFEDGFLEKFFSSVRQSAVEPVEAEEVTENGNALYTEITENLDQLSTKSQSEGSDDEQFRKKARVGNHYQARIPKFLPESYNGDNEDELLWDPFIMDSASVEDFLKQISNISKLLIPMGNHLRDDENALYILQKNKHDVESALKVFSSSVGVQDQSVWSEEECRNFERGLLNFGKNFFLIQKYRVSTKHVGELVQFYYLWKKTERYDLFVSRIRGAKKKYALNPGISDLMCRYLGRGNNVQFLLKDVEQENSQY